MARRRRGPLAAREPVLPSSDPAVGRESHNYAPAMKVFVSADIEGVTGITARDESKKGQPGYAAFRAQMDAEVAAACEGAIAAGADTLVVKDAHGDGRNLSAAALPAPTQLIRGYNGHPLAMVQGLDEGFDAALFIGYHSRGGSGGNPLAHTLSSSKLFGLDLDGRPASEFRLHALAAAMLGVPVVFVTGDRALCDEVEQALPGCGTVAVSEGEGASTRSLHPADAVGRIRAGAEASLRAGPPPLLDTSGPHELELTYRDPSVAYVRSQYPGAVRVDDCRVRIDAADYFEILRALIFLVGI